MEYSTSIYERNTYLFPSSDNSSKLFLGKVVDVVKLAARPSVRFQLYIGVVGLFITFFHLIILSRRSMRTTSVIAIMIGVGICDFVAMIATIVVSWIIYNKNEENDCTPPTPHTQLQFYWIFINIRELVRRCSTWLGVGMALIRFINLKFWTKPEFRKYMLPFFGYKSFIWCFIGSIPFTIIYYFRYEIVFKGLYTPPENCSYTPTVLPLELWVQIPSLLFTSYNGIFGKSYMLVNGILSKIIPCVMMPLLTFLLIIELKRADKVRLSANSMKRKKSDKTTPLVIFMSVTFFIVELPIGIVIVLQVAYTELGYLYIASYVNHIFNAIFTMNAIIHCLLCFLMSAHYRNTVGYMLRLRKKNKFIIAVSTAHLVKTSFPKYELKETSNRKPSDSRYSQTSRRF